MVKYIYKLVDNGMACEIYLLSRKAGAADKYLGKVTLAPGGRSIQEFAHDVTWLPVSRALAELGVISQEEARLQELGFF